MFSISKWAAQTFLAPKTEVKDEAPASNAEMIDLTGDVDSPGAGGSSRDVRSNGGDGATTAGADAGANGWTKICLLYTSPSPRDVEESRMPSSA